MVSGTHMTHAAGALLERLLDIMARLRGPDGCPWDREQTRTSLKAYLVEETYEVLEAIEGSDLRALEEELGDLLFQVVFHAQIARERGEFSMADLLMRVCDKMVSRHPHVFAGASVRTPGEALVQWEAIKQRQAEEAGRPRSVIDGVPRTLPSLLRAQRMQGKASRVRFDWPDAGAAWEKVNEEVSEAAHALRDGDRQRIQEELGDVFFSLVNVARLSGIDAEEAMTGAIEKFRRRFTDMEADLTAQGTPVAQAEPEAMNRAWEAVKARERASNGDRS
jgi:tetrapyrrole methylase family protein / MazG family protein